MATRSKITYDILQDILDDVDHNRTLIEIVARIQVKHCVEVSKVTVWKHATKAGAKFKPPAQYLSELHKQPNYRAKNIQRLQDPDLVAKRAAATAEFNRSRHKEDPGLGRKLGEASRRARLNRMKPKGREHG